MSQEIQQRIVVDEFQQAATEYKEKKYKYDAFISYRHTKPDQEIAQEIHRMIETFRAPKEFDIDGEKTVFRVFRDREELAAKDLSDSIEEALRNSKYLIVICSRRTPLSEWCIKEIQTFRKLHGDSRIIPVLIEGEPSESFPYPLKELKRNEGTKEQDADLQDLLAADIRPDELLRNAELHYEELEKNDIGRLKKLTKASLALLKTEKYRIMAAILGCTFGDLKQRDKERKNKWILSVASVVSAALLFFGIFMFNAYQRAEQARQSAVQSNASILMKSARDFLAEGDSIKAILVAEEAMSRLEPSMPNYELLKAEQDAIFNESIYHSRISPLTTIATKNKLTYFAISEDGKYLAYGLGNNETAIADPKNGALIRVLPGHTEQVKLVAFSPGTEMVASASFDETTRIYDPSTGEELRKLDTPGIPMLLKFSQDGGRLSLIHIVGSRYVVSVYDTKDWSLYGELVIEDTILYADIDPEAKEIALVIDADVPEQLTIRDIKTGENRRTIPRLKEELVLLDGTTDTIEKSYRWARYSKDGESLLAESSGTLLKYSIKDSKPVFEVKRSPDRNSKVLVESENGDTIIMKSGIYMLILDGKTGEEKERVYFSNITIDTFAYHDKSNMLVVSGTEGNIGIWQDGIIFEKNLKFGKGIVTEMSFAPDGSTLLASSHESQLIQLFDLYSRTPTREIEAQIVAASDDGSKILYYDGSNFLLADGIENPPEKIELDHWIFNNYIGETRNYRISNDGRYIAFLTSRYKSDLINFDYMIEVHDLTENKKKEIMISSAELGFSFTSDSKYLITVDEALGLQMFDIETEKTVKAYPEIRSNSYKLFVSADMKTVVINRISGTSDVFDLETGEFIDKIPGEALYAEGAGEERRIKGIYNNAGYVWTKSTGSELFDLDEALTETPVDFRDVNLYNQEAEILLVIRNNDLQRMCYVVDFKSGRLITKFRSSVEEYRINGAISTDGKSIALDQYYYLDAATDITEMKFFMMSNVYTMLDAEKTRAIINEICGGRQLTEEEQIQIGIITRDS